MKLPFLDQLCRLALRRVRRGRVAHLDDRYVEDGLRLGVLLAGLLDELRDRELLTVTTPDPADGLARVRFTDAGQAHYRALCRRQRGPRPQHPTGGRPAQPVPISPECAPIAVGRPRFGCS